MMKKFFYHPLLLTGIFLCLSSGFGFAQEQETDIPTVVPPSPNAASLGKYGNIPVSAYTGVPNIDIPIYEIVSGDIRVPISISYHASGIKVAEEASRVGLGWALNAGGVISRSVMGEDDFLYPSYYDTSIPEIPVGHGPIGWAQIGNKPRMYNDAISGESTIYNLDLSNYLTTSSIYDFQPDQFSYNFNGHSGKFVLKRNKDVLLSRQDKISIKFPDVDANSWEVITADGFKYLFEIFETYTDYNTSGVPSPHKSSWYLTKIISPTGKTVTFNYQEISDQYIKPVGAYSEIRNPKSFTDACTFSCSTADPQAGPVSGKHFSTVLLESIDFDNGRLEFKYEEREDVEGDKRLKNILLFKVNANGDVQTPALKSFAFGYDYFNSTVDKDYHTGGFENYITKRLKLLSLQEVSVSDPSQSKNPYVFSYYEGSNYLNLPTKHSFARDHWGYYNGKHENTSLIPKFIGNNSTDPVEALLEEMGTNRNAEPEYISAFSLKQIQYPTKGKTLLEYEAHTFDMEKSKTIDNALPGGDAVLEQNIERAFYNGNNKGTIYEEELDLTDLYIDPDDEHNVTASVTLTAAVRLSEPCGNSYINENETYFVLSGPDGFESKVELSLMNCPSSGSTIGVYEYANTYDLVPGIYTWKAYVDPSNTSIQDISANYGYFRERVVVETAENLQGFYDFAGGLRISRIIDEDDVSGKMDIKKYVYHYEEDRNADGVKEEYSYGIRMNMPKYSYFEYIQERAPTINDVHCQCARLYITSDSNIPLNGSAAGSVVGYDQVEVLYGENGENGKTKFEYENEPDKIIYYSLYGLPIRPSPVPGIPNEKNGMLDKQTDYANRNGVFTEVKIVEHDNVSVNQKTIYGIDKRNHISIQASTADGSGSGSPSILDGSYPHELDILFYPSLISSHTYVAKTTETTFHDSGVPLTSVTEYRYENPEHLQPTTFITTLSNGKQEVTKIKYPADFSTTESNSVINTMKGDGHMHNTPIEKTTLIREAGVEKIIARSVNKFNSLLLKESVYAIETNEPLDLNAVPPYDPKALTPDDAYKRKVEFSYNEEENIIEIKPYNQPPIAFLLAYGNSLPIAKIKNATFAEVEAALKLSPAIKFEDVNGETYDGATLRTKMDLLRQRLPNAMISSYTFNPLEGINSVTDPAGNTSYFEYDDLSRLKLVKDHLGNIINAYEYNYRVY